VATSLGRAQLVPALERQRRTLLSAAYNEVILAAQIVAGEGRLEDAAVLAAAAIARHAELGLLLPADWHREGHALRARLESALGRERFAAAEARGRALSQDETVLLAIALMSEH
jgi:hypothetical protein